MPQVKQFNIYKAKEKLKDCPKIVQDYVKKLEEANERRMNMIHNCIQKRKEDLKYIEELKQKNKL